MELQMRNRTLTSAITFLALVFLTPATSHPGILESGSRKWFYGSEDTGQPYLATEELNMTAILDYTVSMPCRVFNLRDRTVSWIRSRDLTVLAVDTFTVTTDSRITVSHTEESEDWILEIKGVSKRDQGTYECQVNTHPKISTKIHLKVLPQQDHSSILDIPISDTGVVNDRKDESGVGYELRVRVLGQRRLQVAEGAQLQMVCEATGRQLAQRRHEAPLVSWTLDGFPVTSQWPQDKVLVRESWAGTSLESELQVTGVAYGDGGVYACNIPGALSDRVTVSVIPTHPVGVTSKLADSGDVEEEKEAQEDTGSAASASRAAVLSGAIILALLLIQAVLCVFYIKKI
ncbi:uncharacterized protein LOC122252974 [Penaeus japonicus]|uniref:uncharacterized protein LOC122252974 n=1 Tax=Penaeus japonicus TaxID=27405 RepID=UPI001C7100B2|nr:uncharacterized protein LOC122252974 [Penaeus japonicus]